MPSSGLASFQHDLKARINASPLIKVPLAMRPLVKKGSSNPSSTTISTHSPGGTASTGYAPASQMAGPPSMTDAAIALPSDTPRHIAPPIGTKILDRFWPEDEGSYSEESRRVSVPSYYPTALAPPPHHRRAPQ